MIAPYRRVPSAARNQIALAFAPPSQSSAGAVTVAAGDDWVAPGEPDVAPVDTPEDPGADAELQAARTRAPTEAMTHHRPVPVRSFGTGSAPIVPSAIDRVEEFTADP